MKHRKIPNGGFAMGIHRPGSDALVLTVEQHYDDEDQLCARFDDGSPLISFIPAGMLNLIGFMIGVRLLEDGHDPAKRIRVRLAGSDHDLLNSTIGVAAAPPLPNVEHPVFEPASIIYKRPYAA
jgi:hypothetical protein